MTRSFFHNYAQSLPVWGAFNPYPVRAGQVFPLPPFSSLASVGYYARLVGSIAMVKCLASGGLALARNERDMWNEIFGLGAVFGYSKFLSFSEKRMCWNNRAFAGIAIGSVIYANTAP